MSKIEHLLILPRLRVINTNAIPAPLVWGFPAMSAFTGFMHALERKLPDNLRLMFNGIGVICHEFQALTTGTAFRHSFSLQRSSFQSKSQAKAYEKEGKLPSFVEYGLANMDISLVLEISQKDNGGDQQLTQESANIIAEIVGDMRIAGGTVVPNHQLPANTGAPEIVALDIDDDRRARQFKKLMRRLSPGNILVLRDDVLKTHTEAMQATDPEANQFDAFLDLSRINYRCTSMPGTQDGKANWEKRPQKGWLKPIPVGFINLEEKLWPANSVASARDNSVPFAFVEAIYSIGEWVSVHRVPCPEAMTWYTDNTPETGTYRLNNDYVDFITQ